MIGVTDHTPTPFPLTRLPACPLQGRGAATRCFMLDSLIVWTFSSGFIILFTICFLLYESLREKV